MPKLAELNSAQTYLYSTQSAGRRLYRGFRRWPWIPAFLLVVLVFCGIFADVISPHDPLFGELGDVRVPPAWDAGGSSEFLLGTDHLGRDVLSRIIHGARISLVVATVAVTLGLFLGAVVGMISGFYGGFVDEFIMRLVDVFLAIPYILIALVIVLVFGQKFTTILAILALVTWAGLARQVRAEVLLLREMDYVKLARVAGASNTRIMARHIFPGIVNTLIVVGTLRVGSLILFEAILSFLGAGIPPPAPSWGSMISDGRDFLSDAWWIAFFPGMAIFLTVLALNFVGDWLRDRLDPRLRQVQ
jgi:peptide/nickel transport system permease protein